MKYFDNLVFRHVNNGSDALLHSDNVVTDLIVSPVVWRWSILFREESPTWIRELHADM